MNFRPKITGVVGMLLALLTVAACGHGSAAPSRTPEPGGAGVETLGVPGQITAPTGEQVGLAVAVARKENGHHGSRISGGAVYVSHGKVLGTSSNTGHGCTSGTLLNITLAGEFPGDVTSDGKTVRSLVITADGVSGVPCVIGVGVRTPQFDPNWTTFSIH